MSGFALNSKKIAIFSGAGDGIQTRDLCLGKATLYQLSYSRVEKDHS
jgi:hypothetical protein